MYTHPDNSLNARMYNDIRVNGAVYRDTSLTIIQHTSSYLITKIIFKSLLTQHNSTSSCMSFLKVFGCYLESIKTTSVGDITGVRLIRLFINSANRTIVNTVLLRLINHSLDSCTVSTTDNIISTILFSSILKSTNKTVSKYSFNRIIRNFLESVSNTAVTSVVAAIYATCLRIALHFKLKDYVGDSWFGCAISTHTCDSVIPYSNVVVIPVQESAMLLEEPTIESGYVERQTCVNRGTPEGTQI